MLEGKIERQGFLDIIQLLTMSRKTGRLEITGAAEGSLFFSKGELLDCQMDKLAGDEAFIELFILVSGNFKFHEEKVSVEQRITKSLTDLLMAASRQATQWDAACQELAFEDAALVLAPVDPNSEKQFNFNALGWAVASHINGRRSFAEIARLLEQPKTTVAITIAALKSQGLITTEDEGSAILRTVFRKTTDVLYHLIDTRLKSRVKDRVLTEFNRWTFSKGFDIRLLDGAGVINNLPYDMPLDDKIIAYRQALEQLYEAAQTGLNRNELQDHMAELYEQLNKNERKCVSDYGLNKFIPTRGKGRRDEADFWQTPPDSMGGEGIIPR